MLSTYLLRSAHSARWLIAACCAMVLAAWATAAQAAPHPAGATVVAVLPAEGDVAATTALVEAAGARVQRWLAGPRLLVAESVSVAAAHALSALLRDSGLVLDAAPDRPRPRRGRDLHDLGEIEGVRAQWYANKVCLAGALELGVGSSEVVVAIVDDGFELGHEDLPAPAPGAWDFAGDDAEPAADALDDHGTPVAGIALARAGNERGLIGFCPECGYLPLRRGTTVLDDALAIIAAVDAGAAVINCSWGYRDPPTGVRAAIAYALEHGRGGLGAVVVFAAGNDGDDIDDVNDVSALPGVLAVMESDGEDRLRSTSNVGRSAIAAPGGSQLTTDLALGGYSPGPYTDEFGGTSGAAPIVAGTAALMIAASPGVTAAELRAQLFASAEVIAELDAFDDGLLRRVHTARAVHRAAGMEAPTFDEERCTLRAPEPETQPPWEGAACAMRPTSSAPRAWPLLVLVLVILLRRRRGRPRPRG
jgi:subtilisin family serine protease